MPGIALCLDPQDSHRDVGSNATDLRECCMKANALLSKITSSKIKHTQCTPTNSVLKYKTMSYVLYTFTEVLDLFCLHFIKRSEMLFNK